MIVTKTPLRMSFVGGGSDLPVFYRRFGGAVVSTTVVATSVVATCVVGGSVATGTVVVASVVTAGAVSTVVRWDETALGSPPPPHAVSRPIHTAMVVSRRI